MTIMFSVEICIRLYRAKKRVQDPDLDNLINPHEVKHWVDPKYIPYGWGLFKEDKEEEVLYIERGEDFNIFLIFYLISKQLNILPLVEEIQVSLLSLLPTWITSST